MGIYEMDIHQKQEFEKVITTLNCFIDKKKYHSRHFDVDYRLRIVSSEGELNILTIEDAEAAKSRFENILSLERLYSK